MAPADEAKAHLAEAEKALKPSWMSLKFNPDYLVASMEYTNAATKYRAAGLLENAVKAWIKAAEAKVACADQFGAGRAYESAGAICDGKGPGGEEAAAEHWQKAILCFRLAGKGEIAVKLMLKMAALYEKQKDYLQAKQSFDDVIELYEDDEKDYNLGEVYKQYIAFLLRAGLLDDALKVMDGHIGLLKKQKHWPFVHKEVLSKVVLLLHMGDTVRADEALNPGVEMQGWMSSKECEHGYNLVAGFQANDPEAVATVIKEQIFTFLQVEVARIAKTLRVAGAPVSVGGASTGTGGGGYNAPGASAEPKAPQTKEDMADMLM